MTAIAFPAHPAPVVSIVMVTYGRWDWARHALAAVRDHTHEPYEVVVVDNASPDDTTDRLRAEVENARLLFNPANYGFGCACNQGASFAQAPFVVFLNSDAVVNAGWLPPLLERFDEDERVAVVGPRLLNLDGTLQEAGGVISQLGGTAPFGRDARADLPEFRFRRVVDYVSAACAAVRRDAFHSVGGFDPAYGPGYYEDADLCLALAERGYLTVYEPRSTVTHARNVSAGTERAEELVNRNRSIFFHRWKRELEWRPNSLGLESRRLAFVVRDLPASDRFLVVSDAVPERGERVFQLLERLVGVSRSARVTLLAAVEREPTSAVERLLERGVEVALRPDDLESWFADRRFHYDVVVTTGAEVPAETPDLLRRTQPQAATIDVETIASRPLEDVLADAGVDVL